MIQNFADWLVFSIIGLDNETAFGSAVNFFVLLKFFIRPSCFIYKIVKRCFKRFKNRLITVC